ncbi:MAG: hypothetical protein IPK00_05670 [Deltaproteobacteria bacterium]|nr:hypothetical protein [Deltaproteobacteria bacterium]
MKAARGRAGLRAAVLAAVGLLVAGADSGTDAEAIERHYEQGPVTVDLAVRPADPRIGDVVELRLEVRAAPGVELLMPEFGEALGRFEIVDFAPSESQEPDGTSRARQVYRLQPNRSGKQSIPALRVEFVDRRPGQKPAPEGEDAYEILTERVALDVATILAADAPLELRPARGDLGRRRFPGVPGWAWVVGGIAAVAAAAPFLWRAWLASQARRRQRSAYEIARSELDALLAKGRPEAEALDAFYVALSLIVRRYLENRFALRSPELTTEEFLNEMGRSPDLARSHQQLLRDFLVQADLVKFAGHRPEAAIVDQSIAAAERFLEDTRDLVRLGGEP